MSFGRQKLYVFVTGMLLLAAPALAVEPASEGGKLPQFDVSFFPGQIFWLVISFVLLYLLMAFVALPKVGQTQKRRQDVLAEELAAASAANEKAKTIIAQYEKALADARHSAHVMVNDIMAQANTISAEQQASQHQQLQKRLREAEGKISAARDAALKNSQSAAADLADSMIQKIVGAKLQVQA